MTPWQSSTDLVPTLTRKTRAAKVPWLDQAIALHGEGLSSTAIGALVGAPRKSVNGALAKRGYRFAHALPVPRTTAVPPAVHLREDRLRDDRRMAHAVLARTASLHVVSVADITSHVRAAALVTARFDAAKAMSLAGMIPSAIAAALNRDHSSIVHALARASADSEACARAEAIAAGVGLMVHPEKLADLLRAKMAGDTPANMAAVRRWLEVVILDTGVGYWDTGPRLDHGRWLVQTCYERAVIDCLRSCGMADKALLVEAHMRRARKGAA